MAVSVLTLATAIGAGAATWSLLSAVLLNPLPVRDAELGAAMRHRGLAVHEEAVLGALLDSLWTDT